MIGLLHEFKVCCWLDLKVCGVRVSDSLLLITVRLLLIANIVIENLAVCRSSTSVNVTECLPINFARS